MNCDPEAHKMHICQLKLKGKAEKLKQVTDAPTIKCRQCGTVANSSKYICAAHLKEEAPNVEGGHGVLGFSDIGKVHNG